MPKKKEKKYLKIENEPMVVLNIETTVTRPVLVGTLLGRPFVFDDKGFHYG